jgi:hypothetical protein
VSTRNVLVLAQDDSDGWYRRRLMPRAAPSRDSGGIPSKKESHMQRKPLLAAAFVALMGIGAAAQAQYSAIVSTAPPPPRHEAVPADREGWVWAPGHYEWRGNEYAWVEGHWIRERVGYEYREPRWVQRGDGSWVLVGNNWERRMMEREERREARNNPHGDLDRDGIANRHDRDIDGDGVPNRRDRFPYNVRRA